MRMALAGLAMAALAHATGIVIPLYSYPTGSAWQPILDAAQAHPALQFLVILNPNSGPGDALDQGYAAGVAKLRAGASNVQFIGYVPTGYTKRDAALVNADIDAYATWKASYLIDGIFLDEVSPDQPAFYKVYADKIKGIEWSSGSSGMVMLNPGAPITDDAYYAYADQIMLFEQSYAHWLETKPTFPKPAQTSVVIHSLSDLSAVPSLVAGLQGVASIYITDVDIQKADVYKTFPSMWTDFVNDVAAGAGASPLSASKSTAGRLRARSSSAGTNMGNTLLIDSTLRPTPPNNGPPVTVTRTASAAPSNAGVVVDTSSGAGRLDGRTAAAAAFAVFVAWVARK